MKLFILLLILTHASLATGNCENVEVGSQSLKLPRGLSESSFQELIEIFKSHPQFAEMGGMVLYGSRVHFEYGYKHTSKSDLDLSLIPQHQIETDRRVDIMFHSKEIFSQVSSRAGFEIKEEIPNLWTTKEAMEGGDSRFGLHTRKSERDNWTTVDKNSAGKSRNEIKSEFLITTDGKFTKDSLVVLKGPEATVFQSWLKKREYTNVFVIGE